MHAVVYESARESPTLVVANSAWQCYNCYELKEQGHMMTTVEVRLRELETRVLWLEQAVQGLRDSGRPGLAGANMEKGLLERTRLLAALKAGGLIRDLTPNEQALAARWDALPEDEKQANIRELRNLKPGPMLSDIVIEGRS